MGSSPDRSAVVRWVSTATVGLAVLGAIVAIVSLPFVYREFGEAGIQASSVVTTGLLTLALIVLYFQQYSTQSKQTDLQRSQKEIMQVQYEPQIRIHGATFTETEVSLVLSNGGNGSAENIRIRCDLLVNFDDYDDPEYARMEQHKYELDDYDYELAPAPSGLRRHRNTSAEGISYRDAIETVQGGYLDSDNTVVHFKGIPQVTEIRSSEHNTGKPLPEVLNQLYNSGVTSVSIYLTLVCNDLKEESFSFFVYGARNIKLDGSFESFEAFETFNRKEEGWGQTRLPEEIQKEVDGSSENPHNPYEYFACGPQLSDLEGT
ncbi:hypothetical protein [Natronococcus occultus]|uniref:Uncharacterized protein n=1 Tax=Natronococcus occultus SP4 TaxID=694430 RepID=L0JVA6_9EURY|nr:hypothetical protein [Natronococcus occultus]AGB36711.1 hypothetical protein Natoc_0858 [Natronococcus occultus SP4]